jgi:hypothetical protein
MFTELTLTEMNEIDGGGIKEIVEGIFIEVIIKCAEAAYKELSRRERYIGKPDYRTWLN